MKKFLLALAFLIPASAWGLTQSSTPSKFPIPWGSSAGGSFIRSIPTASQIGINNGWASLTDGFPPLNFQPVASGGVPPFGQDMNGILKQATQGIQWQQAGGPIFWDSAIATGAGGYPKGAIIMSAVVLGDHWMSTVDNNSTNPDSGGANWVQVPSEIQIGTPVQSLSTAIPFGYVSANGLTVGNASSNATGRANADTQFLFTYLWSLPAYVSPIFTSTGASSTRGANAAADFAANKALAAPNMNGLGLMGADSQSGSTSVFLASVPVTSGSSTVPGSILGENLHSLIASENGPHTHTITDPGHFHTQTGEFLNEPAGGGSSDQPLVNGGSFNTGISMTGITINSQGSGTGHNTVERSAVVYWNLKL